MDQVTESRPSDSATRKPVNEVCNFKLPVVLGFFDLLLREIFLLVACARAAWRWSTSLIMIPGWVKLRDSTVWKWLLGNKVSQGIKSDTGCQAMMGTGLKYSA